MRVVWQSEWSSPFREDQLPRAHPPRKRSARWSLRHIGLNMKCLRIRIQRLVAPKAQLPGHCLYTAVAATCFWEAARGLARTLPLLLLLCSCFCYVKSLSPKRAHAPPSPVMNPAHLGVFHNFGTILYPLALRGWESPKLIAKRQPPACLRAEKGTPCGLDCAKTQIFPNARRQSSGWFVLTLAAASTVQPIGEDSDFTSGMVDTQMSTGVAVNALPHNIRRPGAPEDAFTHSPARVEAWQTCGDYMQESIQSPQFQTTYAHGTTAVSSPLLRKRSCQRVAVVGCAWSRGLFEKDKWRFNSSERILQPASAYKREQQHAMEGTGAAKRRLASTYSTEENDETRSASDSRRLAYLERRPQAEDANKPLLTRSKAHTSENPVAGEIPAPSAFETRSQGGTERHDDRWNADVRQRETAFGLFEKRLPTKKQVSAVHPGRFTSSHIVPPLQNITTGLQLPPTRDMHVAQDETVVIPDIGKLNASMISDTSYPVEQGERRRSAETGSRVDILSRAVGSVSERQVPLNRRTAEQNISVGRKYNEGREELWENSRRGRQTGGAHNPVIAQTPVEDVVRIAHYGSTNLGTKPNTPQVSSEENRDSKTVASLREDRFYRAKDIPKTYNDADNSAATVYIHERLNGAGASPSRRHEEQQLPEENQGGRTERKYELGVGESSAEAALFDEVDWADPESATRVESVLRHQVRAMERQVSILVDQLKGIEADMEVYRTGIESVNPKRSADTFEQLVHGGQHSPQQILLEKLQAASESLENRVKAYVRTNSTFYANQLNDIVQVRLAPLRQGVLDLSLSLVDAASSTIDITRRLSEAARHVNATTTREAAQMQALRAHREVAFSEALEGEEIAMQAQLVASQQQEQSRVNKSSVEEQILLSAVEEAVHDMDNKGFAVLDVSAVYPESEARKVLDLALYFAELQTRSHGWELLPIVVVPSSGVVGPRNIPQTASEWLTSVLASADSKLPPRSAGTVVPAQPGKRGARGALDRMKKTNYARSFTRDVPTVAAGLMATRTPDNKAGDGSATAHDSTSSDDTEETKTAGNVRFYVVPQLSRLRRGPIASLMSRWGSTTSSTPAPDYQEKSDSRRKFILHEKPATKNPSQIDAASQQALPQRGARKIDERTSADDPVAAQTINAPPVTKLLPNAKTVSRRVAPSATTPQWKQNRGVGVRRLGEFGLGIRENFTTAPLFRNDLLPANATSGASANERPAIIRRRPSVLEVGHMESRRLSLMEDGWRKRWTRIFGHPEAGLRMRGKNPKFRPQSPTSHNLQLFSAPQLIVGESYADEDEAEVGRKWHAAVLRKTRAVLTSFWGTARHRLDEKLETDEARSILPPIYTLQHLVREHFESLPNKAEWVGLHLREKELQSNVNKSTRYDRESFVGSPDVNPRYSADSTSASARAFSKSSVPHGKKKEFIEEKRVYGRRIGYYVLRAAQILLEGFYVAPGGEVTSVLLRYPHPKKLGPLVHTRQYGIQLLRQLATSFPAKPNVQKGDLFESPVAAAPRVSRVADGLAKKNMEKSTVDHGAGTLGQAQVPAVNTETPLTLHLKHRATAADKNKVESADKCTPARYNPFLWCLTTHREFGPLHMVPHNAADTPSVGKAAEQIRDPNAPSLAQDGASLHGRQGSDAAVPSADVRPLQERPALGASAHVRATAGKNFTDSKASKKSNSTNARKNSGRSKKGTTAAEFGRNIKKHQTELYASPQRHEHNVTPANDRASRSSGSCFTVISAKLPQPADDYPAAQAPQNFPGSQAFREHKANGCAGQAGDNPQHTRKVLIIHLGPRTDGLPLAFPGGAGGKELQRQRLVRRSLAELLAVSERPDYPAPSCGSCLNSAGDVWAEEPHPQKATTHEEATDLSFPVKAERSVDEPKRSKKVSPIRGANKDTDTHEKDEHAQWAARCGQLNATEKCFSNPLSVAKTLQNANLESAIYKQLLALEQELRLASPTRWAKDGTVVEKHLENYQVEISVAWGRPPPALHLPLTPFFMQNVLLLRVEVENCPKKYGENAYSVPPDSVLEQALYLLAHPVAGLAAIAAFHYGRKSKTSFLERLRKARINLDVTASDVASRAANLWGRATGASVQTYWIAHIHVKAPGHSNGSTIELLDGRLNTGVGAFVPSSSSRRNRKRIQFAAAEEAWGWRYTVPLSGNKGPYLRGRVATYGETAKACKPVDALVQSTAANLQTRIIPQVFVSSLRGRSILLAFSASEMQFEGEQLVSEADLVQEWLAETTRLRG